MNFPGAWFNAKFKAKKSPVAKKKKKKTDIPKIPFFLEHLFPVLMVLILCAPPRMVTRSSPAHQKSPFP